jgi:hypothetical protein
MKRYIILEHSNAQSHVAVINREIGKTQDDDYKFELKIGNIISNPTEITEKPNMYFASTVAELIQQNINKESNNNLRQEIKHWPNSVFISPVPEEEVVSLTKNLKDKLSAGYDDIPKSLVKQRIQLIKGPLTHVYH